MSKLANRSPRGTSHRIAHGISSGPSPSPGPGTDGTGTFSVTGCTAGGGGGADGGVGTNRGAGAGGGPGGGGPGGGGAGGRGGVTEGEPTVQARTAPSTGCPSRIRLGPVSSIRSERRPSAKVPLVLPLSTKTHRVPVRLSSACRHDTRASAITMSHSGSRPTRYEGPGGRIRSVVPVRTVSDGAKSPKSGLSATRSLYGD